MFLNLVVLPDALQPILHQRDWANTNFALQGANVRVEWATELDVSEREAAPIMGPEGALDLGTVADSAGGNLRPSLEEQGLLGINRTPGRITVYYVPRFSDNGAGLTIPRGWLGETDPAVFISAAKSSDSTLAHELGHALGLALQGEDPDPTHLMFGFGQGQQPPFSIPRDDIETMRRNVDLYH